MEVRIEHLEAQVHALTQLLLSHISASGTEDESIAKHTLDQAAIQRDSCYSTGKIRAAMVLDDLLSALRDHFSGSSQP